MKKKIKQKRRMRNQKKGIGENNSKYARKKLLQAKEGFSPTSPFRLKK